MRLGVCTIVALDRPLEEAARAAAEAGAEGVEITARPPHWPEQAHADAAERARRAVADHGLEVLALGSYVGKDGPPGEGVLERALADAAALGTRRLRVWAEPGGGGDADVHDWLRRGVERAAARGVELVVERHVGSLADRPERVERLLEAVPGLGLVWQPLDGLPADRAPDQPDDAARFASRTRHVHLKNYAVDPASGRLALGASLAEGVLDWARILARLRGEGYAGPLCLEFTRFAREEESPLAERWSRDLAFARRAWAQAGPAGAQDAP